MQKTIEVVIKNDCENKIKLTLCYRSAGTNFDLQFVCYPIAAEIHRKLVLTSFAQSRLSLELKNCKFLQLNILPKEYYIVEPHLFELFV